MEWQVLVGLDQPFKEDHLQKWTTLTGKFLHKSKHSIKFYFSTEISENVGIMKSTPSFSCPKEGLVVYYQ